MKSIHKLQYIFTVMITVILFFTLPNTSFASNDITNTIESDEVENQKILSAYGYITASTVNVREGPGTSYPRIMILKRYALCHILRAIVTDEIAWYQVVFMGKVGYIASEYFKHLSISELTEFIDSNYFFEGLTNNELTIEDTEYKTIIEKLENDQTELKYIYTMPEPTPSITETPVSHPFTFKSFSWGETEDHIKTIEGEPSLTGKLREVKANYIAYSRTVIGLKALLGYYFCDDGLYAIRYAINEENISSNKCLDDFNSLVQAYTEKYGDPFSYEENWDTESHKEDYSKDKESGLIYGYLSYETLWILPDQTLIEIKMNTTEYTTTTIIVNYTTMKIEPKEANYFDEI